MAIPAARRASAAEALDGLMAASMGHVARGSAPPAVAPDAIEPFLARVAGAYRASRASGLEQGFLAYAPARAGMPLVAEDDSVGTREEIAWHWRHRRATVAFSFHTHPGEDAACVPSGMDLVGATIRGDHLLYILTMDGRLCGWRFRAPEAHPWAVDDALRALDAAGHFRKGFVRFLYDSFDALGPSLVEPVYAARISLLPGDDAMLARVPPDRAFFRAGERVRV